MAAWRKVIVPYRVVSRHVPGEEWGPLPVPRQNDSPIAVRRAADSAEESSRLII